jgi:hypothetical protein
VAGTLGGTRASLRVARRSELALVAVGLALVVVLVYGDHVVRGGFMWDDWENAGTTRYRYEPGFLGPFDLRQAAYRPVLQLMIPLPHLLFGDNPLPHLALALLVAVGAGAAFHALLRALGAPRAYAMAAAALALVFPWSDSTRLWATASLNLVAVGLVLGAGAIAVRMLARPGANPRARVVLTALMCAAGVLTYEAVAGLVLVLPALYRVRAPWRAVFARWRFEALAAGAAALLVALATTKREQGGGAALDHAAAIARQGAGLTGRALVPWGGLPALAGIGVALALVVAAVALRRSAARKPLAAIGLSLAALALAWAPFVPGEAKYVPGAPGIYDRVNIVAGFALAALVCSLAALLQSLLPLRGRARAVLPALLVAAVAGGWVAHARDDVADYDRAAGDQRADLAAISSALPREPAAGTVVVLFHRSNWAAAGVPGFGQPWDLTAALKLRYADPSLTGFPVAPTATVACGPSGVTVDARGTDDPPPAPYARAVLVDGRAGAGGNGTRVSDARACRAAVARLRGRPASA